MKDAVGGSLLLNLVVFFVSIVILFFVGMLAYAKAYKVKNRIVEVIEKHEKYDENVADELSNDLIHSGYMTSTLDQIRTKCGTNNLSATAKTGHLYCVYEDNTANNGNSYQVVTYIHFEFPLIGDILTIPVKGQTKILGKDYNY